jgi:outer membrane protein TolC
MVAPVTDVDARIYELDECLEIADANNISLAKSQASLSSADAGLMSSWSGILPHVSASLSYSDVTTAVGGMKTGSESYGGDINLRQTLFDWGTFSGISGARHTRSGAAHSLESSRRNAALATRRAYYGLLKAEKLLEVQEEALDLAKEQLRKADSLYKLGSASKSDYLKAEVEVGQAELARIAADSGVRTASLWLLYTIGIDIGTEIEVTDPAELTENEVIDFDVETALKRRPDVRAQEEALEAARRSFSAAKAGRLPSLSLTASYGTGGNTLGDLGENYDEDYTRSLGLSLSLPIFDGLATKASIDNSRASLRSYELSLRDTRLYAAYEIETARISVIEQRRNIRVSEKVVEQAGEELRISEERFRLRAASMLDLIYARLAYSRARAGLIEARYDHEIAEAELRTVLGY